MIDELTKTKCQQRYADDSKIVTESYNSPEGLLLYRSSKEERRVDALALRAEERRDKLR